MSFTKKSSALTLRICFKKCTVWKECTVSFVFHHFWCHLSYIFPVNFIEIRLIEDMNFYFFKFDHFCQFFWIFLTFTYYKKLNVNIYKIISAVFWLWVISDRLYKIVLSYINTGIVPPSILKLGVILTHPE